MSRKAKYILPSPIKNKPCDGEMEHAFILGNGLYGCEHYMPSSNYNKMHYIHDNTSKKRRKVDA
jgi:hypothetical protein